MPGDGLDADGKEVGRQMLQDGEALPSAPAGGKVKKVPASRIFRNEEFGYRTITVERPLRDANGKPVPGEKGKLKGKPQPVSRLRDTENVPLSEGLEAHFKREVLPHAPDASELSEGDVVIGMDRPLIASGMRVARVSRGDLPGLLLQRVAKVHPVHLWTADSSCGFLVRVLSRRTFRRRPRA